MQASPLPPSHRKTSAKRLFPIHVTDPEGRKVLIRQDCWQHAKDRHSQLADGLDEIKRTLSAPEFVESDDRGGLRYYRRCPKIIKKGFLMAVVSPRSGKQGGFVFVTAYPVRDFKKGGVITWPKASPSI